MIKDEKLQRYLVLKIPYNTSKERDELLDRVKMKKGATFTEEEKRSLPFLKLFLGNKAQSDYVKTLEKKLVEELGTDPIKLYLYDDSRFGLEAFYYGVTPPAIVLCDACGGKISTWQSDIDPNAVIYAYLKALPHYLTAVNWY